MAPLQLTAAVDPRTLAARRRRLGLTQAQLGEEIGARSDDIARFERALVPGELADRIVEFLDRAETTAAAQ